MTMGELQMLLHVRPKYKEEKMELTLEEAKTYLHVDSSDEDALIRSLVGSATELCRNVARLGEDDDSGDESLMKGAVLYTLGYIYEHREDADHHELVMTLRSLLSSIREGAF